MHDLLNFLFIPQVSCLYLMTWLVYCNSSYQPTL